MGCGASRGHPVWYPGEPCSCLSTLENCGTTQEVSRYRDDNGPSRGLVPMVKLTQWKFVANGAFCSIYTATYKGLSVVVKTVRSDLPLAQRRVALQALWQEHECLRFIDHPNIVDLYGLCRFSEEEFGVCLLVERLALGTLAHLLETNRSAKANVVTFVKATLRKRRLSYRTRLNRVLELALALEHVHETSMSGMTMMHRDIKSVNVGFSQDGRLKLFDFGLAKFVCPLSSPENELYKMTGEVGSFRYMAPELVLHKPYNAKADIYSLALLAWEILTGERPFRDLNESTFIK
ncbi:unnamed protein product, partial [Discosporangium mesarthrocarpum]